MNLVRRMTYLERERAGDVAIAGRDIETVVAELEEAEFGGKSLKIVPGNHLYIEEGTKFNARHLLIDHGVLLRISDGDPQALDDIPKTISIRSFAQKKTSNYFQKRKSRSSVPSVSAAVPAASGIFEEDSIPNTPADQEDPIPSVCVDEEEVVEEEIMVLSKKSRKNVIDSDDDDGGERDVPE